jgi:hypothetical protein
MHHETYRGERPSTRELRARRHLPPSMRGALRITACGRRSDEQQLSTTRDARTVTCKACRRAILAAWGQS